MKSRTTLCFLFLWLSMACWGQSGKLFTVDKELSSSLINTVYQDRHGIIWIATEDGLNRYDGSKFTTYKHIPNDEQSLLNNHVRVIFEDTKGRFFVGTQTGVQSYDAATDQFTRIPMCFNSGTEISPTTIASIIERQNGDIIVGTSGHGIFKMDRKCTKAIQQDISTSFLIVSLMEDRDKNLWISTEDKGVVCIDKNKRAHSYLNDRSMIWNSVSCFYQDKMGRIYAGSLGKGLFVFNKAANKFAPITYEPNPDLPIKVLYPTNQDEIYIGTDGNGLKILNIHTQKITESFSNTSFDAKKSKIHSIIKDRMGNIWLGFYQKGVMLIPASTNEFKYVGYKSPTRNFIGSNCVMSLFKGHDNVLWIGTDNDGLYALNPGGTFKSHFAHTQGKNSVPATIMSIFEDSRHNIWLGSYLNGMAKLDPQTGRCDYQYGLLDSKSNYVLRVYSFAEDKHGRLWIGTMGGGLFYMDIDSKKITHCPDYESGVEYRTNGNLVHNKWINCLLHTHNEKLYLGTYDGIGCLDLKTMDFVSTYKRNRLLEGNTVFTLFEDKKGFIWVGTAEGLIRLNPKNEDTTKFTTKDGLPSNVICSIKGDAQGNLWISTGYGISKFNPDKKTFTNYYAGNGLQGNEFSKNAACTDDNDGMFFGGINGVTYFRPQEITTPIKAPEILITDFYVSNRAVRKGMKSGARTIINTSVREAKVFKLSYKDNSFTIEFATNDLYNPERITYTYTIDGKNWTSLAPGVNRVSFSELPSGTYHFKVKAKDYTIYSEEKEITIKIAHPWYASVIAKLLYLLLIAGGSYFTVEQLRNRQRVREEMLEYRHAEQINEAKLQFFMNISHEIRTPMSLIISPLQKLIALDANNERQKSYHIIFRNAERILRLVNQLLDIRKIDKGQMAVKFSKVNLATFIEDLSGNFEYQIENKKIALNFNFEKDVPEVWIDPQNFDKVILNLLSNAFKFTPNNGHIDISLRQGVDAEANANEPLQHFVEIVVSDSGIGIQPDEVDRIFERFYQIRNSNAFGGTGIGLHLSRLLVGLHHGTIKAENNELGNGCRFIVRIPQGCSHLAPEDLESREQQAEPISMPDIAPFPFDEDESSKARSKSKYRVVIAEDDDEIRQYICNELSEDFHMIECKNGKEALATILKHTPHLVISDVIMPEMDGMTLCRKIKQNVNINHVPVILLTARTREEDTIEGLNIGADAYLTKPFNIGILKKNVENLIRGRELLRNCFSGNQEQEERKSLIEIQSTDNKLLDKIMNVINRNISNPDLNVEMIASEVGISRVHLHRKLKELTNQSTRDLIRNVRLKQAAHLLAHSKCNVSEAGSLTGFTNPTIFSRAFKELFGVTPSAYAENQENENISEPKE